MGVVSYNKLVHNIYLHRSGGNSNSNSNSNERGEAERTGRAHTVSFHKFKS